MLVKKQFLISQDNNGSYKLEICSGLSDLLIKCADMLIDDPKSSLLIDAGFLVPSPERYSHILKRFAGNIIITEPASSVFFEIPTSGIIGCVEDTILGEKVSLLLVDHEYSRALWEITSLLKNSPAWILGVEVSSLIGLKSIIKNKLSYYEIKRVQDLLEYRSGYALLCLEKLNELDLADLGEAIKNTLKQDRRSPVTNSQENIQHSSQQVTNEAQVPFNKWILDADVNDPIAILERSPDWLLELDVAALIDIPTRLKHRCLFHEAKKVSDLLQYTSGSILKWDGIGETSLQAFSRSILATLTAHGDEKSNKISEATFDTPSNLSAPFDDWIKSADLQDPIAIIQRCPEWVLQLDAKKLVNLSVRLKNRLELHEIRKVKDLLQYTSQTILRWPEVGRKSLEQLSSAIIATITAGKIQEEISDREGKSPHQAPSTLRDKFEDALELLQPRELKVLKMRLGYHMEKSMTLEEIGHEFRVTRERIRQIEVKAKRKLKALPLWRDRVIENKVTALMKKRTEPCYLDLIFLEDDWFEGFAYNTKCLGKIIEDACCGKINTLNFDGRDVITKITSENWDQSKREIIPILETHIPSRLTKEDVLLLIESHLGMHGASELTSILFDHISPQLHFVLSEDGEDELASVGRGTNSIVLAVLKSSSTPLHYSEVHSRCIAMGYDVDIRRVHNALPNVSWLFSLGTYGLQKHFPLTKSEEAEVRSQLEYIILQGDPNRQWNSSVLLEQLLDSFPETLESVDKYIVNIILSRSKVLVSLGRFIWVRSDHAKKQNIDRIDLQEASTALIERSGRPMSTKELKDQIRKQRGISEYFCLKVTPIISRVSPNVWGLVDRDFHLDHSQIKELLNCLYSSLISENQGLYLDETRAFLEKYGQQVPEQLTDYMIFSLAQTDSRFAIRRGQLLGLAEWSSAKRLTIREASCKAASELDEFICSADLRPRIEKLIGRKVSENNQFNEGIRDAGFVYDETKHKWKRCE